MSFVARNELKDVRLKCNENEIRAQQNLASLQVNVLGK